MSIGYSESEPSVGMSVRYSCIHTLHGIQSSVNCLSFSLTGKELAIGLVDGTVKIFAVGSGRELRTITGSTGVTALLWHPSKPRTLFAGYENGKLSLLSVRIFVLNSILRINNYYSIGFWRTVLHPSIGSFLRSHSIVRLFSKSTLSRRSQWSQRLYPQAESSWYVILIIFLTYLFRPVTCSCILVRCLDTPGDVATTDPRYLTVSRRSPFSSLGKECQCAVDMLSQSRYPVRAFPLY